MRQSFRIFKFQSFLISILIHIGIFIFFLIELRPFPSPAQKQAASVPVVLLSEKGLSHSHGLPPSRFSQNKIFGKLKGSQYPAIKSGSSVPAEFEVGPQRTEGQGPRPGLTFSHPGLEARVHYFSQIRERIEAFLEYPYSIRRRKLQGQVGVKLVLNSKGLIETCEVGQSSGSEELDQLAMSAVNRAAPFPGLESHLKSGDKVQLNLPIYFKLE